jgi:hypothetical protein
MIQNPPYLRDIHGSCAEFGDWIDGKIDEVRWGQITKMAGVALFLPKPNETLNRPQIPGQCVQIVAFRINLILIIH